MFTVTCFRFLLCFVSPSNSTGAHIVRGPERELGGETAGAGGDLVLQLRLPPVRGAAERRRSGLSGGEVQFIRLSHAVEITGASLYDELSLDEHKVLFMFDSSRVPHKISAWL